MAKRKEDDDKMKELEKASQGTGVKAMKAKAELEQMRVRSQTGQNMAEVRAAFKKKFVQCVSKMALHHLVISRQAQRNLAKADPLEEEMKRVELEKKKRADEEAMKRKESQRRLKEKAAAFGN